MQKAAKPEPRRCALSFLMGSGSVWGPARENAEYRENVSSWDFQ